MIESTQRFFSVYRSEIYPRRMMKRVLQGFFRRWFSTLSFLQWGSREVRCKLINAIIHARVFILMRECRVILRHVRVFAGSLGSTCARTRARRSDKNRFVMRLYLSCDSIDRRSPHDEKSCFRSVENRSVSGCRFVPSSILLRLIEHVLKKVLSKK